MIDEISLSSIMLVLFFSMPVICVIVAGVCIYQEWHKLNRWTASQNRAEDR